MKTHITIKSSLTSLVLTIFALTPGAWATTWYSQGSLDAATTGSWNSIASGGGSVPGNFATSGDIFLIQNGHSMTTSGAWTLATGVTLEIANGGSLTATAQIASLGTFKVDAGGYYIHNWAGTSTSGSITDFPGTTRTLDPASTVEIQAWGGTQGGTIVALANPVAWGNLIINMAAQNATWGQAGTLTTVNGTLTIKATGSPTTRDFALATTQTYTLTIGGDLVISGGSLKFSGTGSTPSETIKLYGNYYQTGGAFAANGSVVNPMAFIFDSHSGAAPSATYTRSGGSYTGKAISLTVGAGKTLTLNSSLNTGIPTNVVSQAFTVTGTLNCGANVISGGSTFTLNSGATLGIGSPDGISTIAATGNIQVTNTQSFSSSANYLYNGTAPQVAGTALPATVASLTINNANGVSLSQNVTDLGALNLTSGSLTTAPGSVLTLGNASTITGASSSQFLNGPLAWTYSATGSRTFPIGLNGNYRAVSLNLTTLSGTPTITITPHEPASFGGAAPASTTLFSTRDWTVASSVSSGNVGTLTVDGTDFSPVGAGLLVDWNGTTTANLTTTGTAPVYAAANVGLTASSDFTLGDFNGSAPLGVTTQNASGRTSTGVTLNGTVTGDNGSGLTGFGFYWSASPGVSVSSTKAQVGTSGFGPYPAAFAKTIGSLSVNTIYYYRAYAVNPGGSVLDSSDVSFYTLANTPAAPTVNGATASSLNVTINAGDGNPSGTPYAIYETTSGKYVTAGGLLTSATPVFQTKATWGSPVVVSGLTSCSGYVFEVQAQNGDGISTALSLPAAPAFVNISALGSPPTAAAATGIGIGTFTANWSAVAKATSYYLDVSFNSTFTALLGGYANLNVGNVTSTNLSSLVPGTYYYRVRAANCVGPTASSGTITVTGVTGSGGPYTMALPFYDNFNYAPATNGTGLARACTNEAGYLLSGIWVTLGISSAQVTYQTTGLIAPAGLAPAQNGAAGSTAGASPRGAGMQYVTQSGDGASVYYSFIYRMNSAPNNANINGVYAAAIASCNNLKNPTANTNAPDGTAATILINTNLQVGLNQGGGSTANGTSAYGSKQLLVGNTYLIVARYTFHTGAHDTVDLWVSPASSSFGASAPVPDVTVVASGSGSSINFGSLSQFTIYNDGGTGLSSTWDEVRIGSTWASVTPGAPETISSFSGLTSRSIAYGTSGASLTLSGKVSGPGPVYPANGDTVAATINGRTVNGTVTDNVGSFTILYNDVSLTTLPAGVYAINYQYAGNANLNYSASPVDVSTSLTVTPPSGPTLVYARSGNVLTLSWADASYHLQSQTNPISVGISQNWGNYPDLSNPISVTNNPANPTVFFRLSQ